MESLFPICDGDCTDHNMEAQPIPNSVRCVLFDGSFDALNSPQYLNFSGSIPEAKDSYFERKLEDDLPAVKLNNQKLQKLPLDYGEDDLRHDVPQFEEDAAEAESEAPPVAAQDEVELGPDLIQSVKTLGVNEAFAKREKTLMITSTPFRVEGIQQIPWEPVTKAAEKPHCTKARPFSFEERNKQIQQRKARRLQTIMLAEKEARKFRANPVPKFLKKKSSTNNSVENETAETQMSQSGHPRFRAKSPKVLRRPPFQPTLPKQHLIPQPFVLHSELRAQERAAFNNCLKEKERLNERLQELMQAAKKRREEEEIVKLRKAMIPKAQPIRKFKSADVRVPKRPLTEPITPRVIKRQRR